MYTDYKYNNCLQITASINRYKIFTSKSTHKELRKKKKKNQLIRVETLVASAPIGEGKKNSYIHHEMISDEVFSISMSN
jgi:hypothetical protein